MFYYELNMLFENVCSLVNHIIFKHFLEFQFVNWLPNNLFNANFLCFGLNCIRKSSHCYNCAFFRSLLLAERSLSNGLRPCFLAGSDALGHSKAIHLWHLNVGEDQSDTTIAAGCL